jgi:hypothetical protein
MPKDFSNYYTNRDLSEEAAGYRRYNLEEAMKDKLAAKTTGSANDPLWQDKVKAVQGLDRTRTNINSASNLNSVSISNLFGPGYEEISAPTTDPTRPRAKACGYNALTETLVIIFRDNEWIQYDNVSRQIWENLKMTDSTGKFLLHSGLNGIGWKKTNYGSLPRTRPGNFQAGTQTP